MIQAGAGGGGGYSGAGDSEERGGAGAAGGAGLRLVGAGDILNIGTIAGGNGGAGYNDYYHGGAGGGGGAGVALMAGGQVTNLGLIEGGAGGAATVTNAGTIAGAIDSVLFRSAGDVLIADAGAVFVRAVVGGGGTLELAGGTGVVTGLGGAGVVSGSASASFSGFDSYVFGPAGRWSLSGTSALGAGQDLTVDGSLTVADSIVVSAGAAITTGTGGALSLRGVDVMLGGSIVNDGQFAAQGTTVTISGAVTGFGRALIDQGTLAVTSAFSQDVTFSGKSGTLVLDQSQSFQSAISAFAAGGQDVLDLGDIAFVSKGEASFSGFSGGGVLTVDDGTHSASLELIGDYAGDSFTASSDGHGGVDVIATSGGAASIHALTATLASIGPHGVVPHYGGLHATVRPMLVAPSS